MTASPPASLAPADVPTLVTARLRLRRLTVDDAAAMAGLLGDDHAAIQMTSHVPDPCTVAGARAWLELRTGPDGVPFAIERDGAMIGSIGLHLDPPRAGMGYWLGRAHWGQGLATEAAAAVLAFAASLGIRAVDADTYAGNAASARVLTKLGFTYVDTIDELQEVRGGLRAIDRFVWRATTR